MHLILLGGDLRKYIDTHGGKKENLPVYLNLFKQMVEGLDEVHKNGESHCGIEPDNVFLHKSGLSFLARLGPFGV